MSRFMPKAIALAAAGLLIAGCGQVAEKATQSVIESATGTDIEMTDEGMTITDGDSSLTVDSEGQTVTMTDEAGTSTFQSGEGAQLPDSYPSDLPTPRGGLLSTVGDTPEGLFLMWGYDSYTGADFEDYVSEIKAAGYTIVNDIVAIDSADGLNRSASFSGGGKLVTVTAMGSSDFGQVSVMITEESP
jgi:hypothetical protein